MRLRSVVAVVVAVLVVGGWIPSGTPSAQAQDAKPAEAKGVTVKGLVGSTGPIARIPATVPIVVTGQVVEIQPGGQTGRQRQLVPSVLYVLEGILTIDTDAGPIGAPTTPISISGIQYHGTGQTYSPPAGLWYNAMNSGLTPVKYLLLLIGTPGGPTLEQAKADD